jgi:hypothetical protein
VVGKSTLYPVQWKSTVKPQSGWEKYTVPCTVEKVPVTQVGTDAEKHLEPTNHAARRSMRSPLYSKAAMAQTALCTSAEWKNL